MPSEVFFPTTDQANWPEPANTEDWEPHDPRWRACRFPRCWRAVLSPSQAFAVAGIEDKGWSIERLNRETGYHTGYVVYCQGKWRMAAAVNRMRALRRLHLDSYAMPGRIWQERAIRSASEPKGHMAELADGWRPPGYEEP